MEELYLFTSIDVDLEGVLQFSRFADLLDGHAERLKASFDQIEREREEFGFFFANNMDGTEHLVFDVTATAELESDGEVLDIRIDTAVADPIDLPVVAEEHKQTLGEVCMQVIAKLEEQSDMHRVLFYRILVSEYRITFGDKDPSVSEALTLLAASLAELNQKNEAESHLREAIVLLPENQSKLQRQLLGEILKK